MENESEQGMTVDCPFSGDKLGRDKVAAYLTQFLLGKHTVSHSVKRHRSFVLNINSEWGAGKTYFLTEWAKQLRDKQHIVVTFDAWKNDFSKQPLIGFMSEIERQLRQQLSLEEQARADLDGLVRKGKRLFKTVAPALVFHAVKAVSGLDVQALKEMDWSEVAENADISGASEKLAEKIKDQLYKENEDTKHAIEAFKSQLCKIVELVRASDSKKLPLFFFVDELDRCRPSFSIELLEDIKHLFGIDDVYFVIATDSGQLGHSICAVYGDQFDARAYLRRFFDQEYSLPEPDRLSFAAHLFSEYGLDNEVRLFSPLHVQPNEAGKAAVKAFAVCGDFFRLSLRDQDQVCAMLDAIRLTSMGMNLHVLYLVFLMMLRLRHNDLFDQLSRGKSGMREVLEQLDNKTVDKSATVSEFRRTTTSTSPINAQLFDVMVGYYEFSRTSLNELRTRNLESSTATNIVSRLVEQPKELEGLCEYPRLVKSAASLIHLY